MFPQGSDEYLDNNRQYVFDRIRARGAVSRVIVDRTPNFIRRLLFHLIFRRYYRAQVSVECKLRTISDVIDEQSIQRIDYLKIDTEGAELNVLNGIRSDHWPIIRQAVIEVHDGGSGLQKVLEILERNGFHFVVEQPSDTLSHLRMVYAARSARPPAIRRESNGTRRDNPQLERFDVIAGGEIDLGTFSP